MPKKRTPEEQREYFREYRARKAATPPATPATPSATPAVTPEPQLQDVGPAQIDASIEVHHGETRKTTGEFKPRKKWVNDPTSDAIQRMTQKQRDDILAKINTHQAKKGW